MSIEKVCSGIGLPSIYRYLRDRGGLAESAAVSARLQTERDPTPVIVAAALDPVSPCELRVATLDMFVSVLAAEAGNLALKVLATGSVYLAGGIPLHILPALEKPRFMEAFRRKGRLGELLARIPVHVIVQRAALLGLASYVL